MPFLTRLNSWKLLRSNPSTSPVTSRALPGSSAGDRLISALCPSGRVKPDYAGGSIVNLMGSICQRFSVPAAHPPLRLRLKDKVVLMVLDGLGYRWLTRYGKNSFLAEHLQGSMTSVFPPTTAAAIPSFITGLTPLEHGLTGWFVHLKELGCVTAVLPFRARAGGPPFDAIGVPGKRIFTAPSLLPALKGAMVIPTDLAQGAATEAFSGGCPLYTYGDLPGYFSATKAAAEKYRFVYSYWPGYDSLCHKYGCESKEVKKHFEALDDAFAELKLRNVIVTADHGMLDTDASHVLKLTPAMERCLALPLCGEPRTAYCYLRPGMQAEFSRLVQERFGEKCDLCSAADLVREGWFGKGVEHPRFRERIGDVVLRTKGRYIVQDRLLGQKKGFHIGNHGGGSEEELLVPLSVRG